MATAQPRNHPTQDTLPPWPPRPGGRPHGNSEYGPAECPFGHLLGPGKVLVGWAPCQCKNASDRHGGHRTHTCRACAEMGQTKMISFDPPHLLPQPGEIRRGDGWDGEP